ncbi:hypothetical protein C8R44DRAFT_801420 [Mycena epipterygia]|nr:hypothetical protein C8R44DRAFT_801420 [Mycena epipterygia]
MPSHNRISGSPNPNRFRPGMRDLADNKTMAFFLYHSSLQRAYLLTSEPKGTELVSRSSS